jgi:UDP-N-acetylglucosamine acyltransferase
MGIPNAPSITYSVCAVDAVSTARHRSTGVAVNTIHPTAVISDSVSLGEGNTIGPFVVIDGPVTIGSGNWIGAGAIIGAPPEVRSFRHPRIPGDSVGGGVIIGNDNVIREHAQIHQGWKSTTRVGDRAFLMNQVYVAHDCHIGDDVTLASSVLLAGHVHLGDRVNLGLGTSVHQFRYVGTGSMVGMGSVVTRSIPPYAKAYGNPARLRGVNTVGMERSGIPADAVAAVVERYGDGGTELRVDGLQYFESLADAFSEWHSQTAS